MKFSLGISNFLKEISNLPILLFSSISLHLSLRKAFLSLLAILWNSTFKWLYLSFLLCLSLLFTAICKALSDNHFAFLPFFFFGDGLADCLLHNVSVLHPQFFSHSIKSNPLNLSLPLYNHKGFDLGHT